MEEKEETVGNIGRQNQALDTFEKVTKRDEKLFGAGVDSSLKEPSTGIEELPTEQPNELATLCKGMETSLREVNERMVRETPGRFERDEEIKTGANWEHAGKGGKEFPKGQAKAGEDYRNFFLSTSDKMKIWTRTLEKRKVETVGSPNFTANKEEYLQLHDQLPLPEDIEKQMSMIALDGSALDTASAVARENKFVQHPNSGIRFREDCLMKSM